jgi:galactonate dehydratase
LKITRVETLHCDGGWRPWSFVKIQTDEGITGYGECFDREAPWAIAGAVRDMEPLLVGHDPRPIELLNWNMARKMVQSPGGLAQKAIGGVDAALWDIKAKALGLPVYELLGGPTRDRVRVYWSHCGTARAHHWKLMGTSPIRTLDDIHDLGQEVVRRGFTALKTNIVIPGEPARVHGGGSVGAPGTTDLNITNEVVQQTVDLIDTFRQSVGPNVDICLDLNFNFKMEGFERLTKALEPYNLLWAEIDTYDPQALLRIKQQTSTRICSGECLYTMRGYRPFFDLHAMDIAMVDVPWNGLTQSKKIADLADTYEINVAPHNRSSHLASLMCAHLCAATTNVRIMEYDVDDVPWKDELITEPMELVDGQLIIPSRPGWGADLNEKEVAKHPWPK